MEIWKRIDGFDFDYYVSTAGNVSKGIQLLKQSTVNGYKVVALRRNGKYVQQRVHRLVASAFINNPENLPQVNHKDENKSNNCLGNLEWCTALYNNTYGSRPEKIRASNSRRGCPLTTKSKIKQSVTKLQGKRVAQLDGDGNIIGVFSSTADAERITKIPHSKISAVCMHRIPYYKNTFWKYL